MLDRAGWVVQVDSTSRLQTRGYDLRETPSNGVVRGIVKPKFGTQQSAVGQASSLSVKKTSEFRTDRLEDYPTKAFKMNVILYTRTGCHLCDDAEQVLAEHGLQAKKVDIDANADESLREQFDTCVPVVEIDGKVRFRGQVDPLLLKRLLHKREERP